MNLCGWFFQCGIESCSSNENNEVNIMGASLSNEIPTNADNITFSEQLSMQIAARYVTNCYLWAFSLQIQLLIVPY